MNKFSKAVNFSLGLSLVLFSLMVSLPVGGNTANAAITLKQKEPGLCYTCHEELKKSLASSYTHFLFKEGKCRSCHSPHASDHRGLMQEEINSLCLNCHKRLRELIEKNNTHGAVKQGICTDCHYAHSGENKHLLIRPSNELCWECHKDLSEQLTQSYVHPLFEQGDCSSCHNAHASPEENLLRDKPNSTCKKCHGPRCTAGEVSIASVTSKLDCTSCHTGHSSHNKGLLGPFGHTAFLNKTCEECHEPILSSDTITLRVEGKDLCFSCHKRETPDQFIDDDIHVKDAKNPCLVCHGPHASNSNTLTVSEVSLCKNCHESTEKSTAVMEKAVENANCSPISNRHCFKCHMLECSSERPLYYSGDATRICVECHTAQHSISHPVGDDAIDPRDGKPMTCLTCHSMHSSRFDYMLIFEGDKALCLQCHRVRT